MEIIIRDDQGRITEYNRNVIRTLIDEALEHVAAGKVEDFNLVCDRIEGWCQMNAEV